MPESIKLEQLSDSADAGVVLPVKAQPGSRKDAVKGVHDGALKVSCTQVAEKGKANDAIRRLLCKSLELKKSQVELISGPTSANKKFLIREISLFELQTRLAKLG